MQGRQLLHQSNGTDLHVHAHASSPQLQLRSMVGMCFHSCGSMVHFPLTASRDKDIFSIHCTKPLSLAADL